MKVSERSYDNEFCNEIDFNGLKISDIIDTSFSGERWEDNSLNGLPFGYGCVYHSENQLIYKVFMFTGMKVNSMENAIL